MSLADDYRAYVKSQKRRLKALPYFGESEERSRAFKVLFEVLERHSFEGVLRWEANPCSDPIYRVLALDFLRHRERNDETMSWADTTRIEHSTLVQGNLHVHGNLINGATLTVLGDLVVDGAYVTEGDYPCCTVGGTFWARDYFAFEAEFVALQGIRIKDVFAVFYNHTITIAPDLEADVVCVEDSSVPAEVRAERSFIDAPIPYAELFGLDGDDPHEAIADWMLRGGRSASAP